MKIDFSRRCAWALAAGLFYASAAVGISSGQNAPSNPSRKVVVISLDSEITLGLSAYVRRALEEAGNAKAIVLRIDTFGGRVDAALEIAKNVEKPTVPVFAWVEDKAWSAGALISLACSEIYMSKSASIGSATPVQISGGKTKAVGEKHVSALRAKFRALAERNNYPPELAAAMVDKDIEVYRVKAEKPDEEDRFITTKESGAELVIAKGKLLNLSAKKAIEYGIAEPADSIRALLKKEGIENPEIVLIQRTGVEKFINVITGSAAASLLVFLGFMLISGEMHMPGFGWMGATGVACFMVVFWGHYLADLAGWIDLLLILAGLLLIGLEIFVVPGFGITGISGFALLVVGLYLMVVPFVVPSSPWDWDRLKEVVWVLVAAGAGGVAGVVSLILMIPRLPMFNRAALATDAGSTAPSDPVAAGELAAGRRGLTITALAPTGRVQFGTQFVDARAKSGAIAKGANVEVVESGKVPVVRAVG